MPETKTKVGMTMYIQIFTKSKSSVYLNSSTVFWNVFITLKKISLKCPLIHLEHPVWF